MIILFYFMIDEWFKLLRYIQYMLSVGGKIQFLLHIVFKALCGNVFHTNHHDAIHLLVYLFRLGMGPQG